MSKSCGRCRRFLSPAESTRCQDCAAYFHRRCVSLPPAGPISQNWRCPGCLKNKASDLPASVTRIPETPTLHKQQSPDQHLNVSNHSNSTFESTNEITHDITDELRTFRDHLRSINSDLRTFRDELAEIRASLKDYQVKVTNLEERVGILEERRPVQSVDVNDTIAQLREELGERDQELLANDVDIVNVPETMNENPIHIVVQIGVKIGMTIEERDIVSAERVGGRRIVATAAAGPETRPRPLAVRLARRDLRDTMLRNARARRGATTADLGMLGSPRRFFVNERLTRTNRYLFRLARDASLQHGWKFVWVSRGRILARNKSGDKAYHIRCESDIAHVFNSAAK